MTSITCNSCGIRFDVPDLWAVTRQRDLKTFYCPNGHPLTYRESETDKLRRERDRLKQQMARVEQDALQERTLRKEAERQASARKGVVTRLKNRVAKGVCPCCNRSFENLQRHMSGQHPKYLAEEIA